MALRWFSPNETLLLPGVREQIVHKFPTHPQPTTVCRGEEAFPLQRAIHILGGQPERDRRTLLNDFECAKGLSTRAEIGMAPRPGLTGFGQGEA